MLAADATGQRPAVEATFLRRLSGNRSALIPALAGLALMLLWAADNGGYDAGTWYWGALALLAVLAITLIALGAARPRFSRASLVALCAFAAFLLWSYLSMTWAEAPGWALEGSNRTLLYFLVFALFLVLPWTPEAALATLLVFVLGVGTIALVLLLRFASSDHVQRLAIDGRLAAPTGYFNSTVALFMMNALLATVLSTRRELPGLLRGALTAIACASLQLCVMGQSRGWLFTLALVVVIAIVLVGDRLRVAAAAVLPIAGTLAATHTLLHAFPGTTSSSLADAAASAGHASLRICLAVLVLGTLIAWVDKLGVLPSLSRTARRAVGVLVTALVLVSVSAGAIAATHGDPVGFVKRQWNGFSHQAAAGYSGSHFAAVGSGRYDFWRVSLDALAAHPIGGLGQDNFSDYYVSRRRTDEEPRWTHSLEMRLLAHTGLVGFGLFAAFLIAALAAATPALRRGTGLTRIVAGAGLLPLVVWLVHGSVDWFWEVPALSGPALGFLGMAAALGMVQPGSTARGPSRRRVPRAVPVLAGAIAFIVAVVVLVFPFLSVREIAAASDLRQSNPTAALHRLSTAADLNPLSPDPGRLGGTIALQSDQFTVAERRFHQAISSEPGGWFAWLGDGLAASALGDSARAYSDFRKARSINSREPVIQQALADVYTKHPLTVARAFGMLTTS
jgi:hypothetical protein